MRKEGVEVVVGTGEDTGLTGLGTVHGTGLEGGGGATEDGLVGVVAGLPTVDLL